MDALCWLHSELRYAHCAVSLRRMWITDDSRGILDGLEDARALTNGDCNEQTKDLFCFITAARKWIMIRKHGLDDDGYAVSLMEKMVCRRQPGWAKAIRAAEERDVTNVARVVELIEAAKF